MNRFFQKEVLELISDISEKTGLTQNQVKEIVISQFDYLIEEMRKGDIDSGLGTYKHIQLYGLGTFYVEPSTIKGIQRRRQQKKNRKDV